MSLTSLHRRSKSNWTSSSSLPKRDVSISLVSTPLAAVVHCGTAIDPKAQERLCRQRPLLHKCEFPADVEYEAAKLSSALHPRNSDRVAPDRVTMYASAVQCSFYDFARGPMIVGCRGISANKSHLGRSRSGILSWSTMFQKGILVSPNGDTINPPFMAGCSARGFLHHLINPPPFHHPDSIGCAI